MALSDERKGRLTASYHAQALGFGYLSLPQAWDQFNGVLDVTEESRRRIDWGNAHEMDAVSAFEAITGELCENTGDDQLWTPYEDWSGCTTDGLVGERGTLEAKCPTTPLQSPREAWWIQVQSQLHITGRDEGWLVMWYPNEVTIWKTLKDNTWWPSVEPMLKDFWVMVTSPREMLPKRWKKPKIVLDAISRPQWWALTHSRRYGMDSSEGLLDSEEF